MRDTSDAHQRIIPPARWDWGPRDTEGDSPGMLRMTQGSISQNVVFRPMAGAGGL